jgi:NAD(P)H-dependent FMN reductase
MSLKLQTIITSTRPSRAGAPVADWFHGLAVKHGKFDASLVDLASFNLPVFDEAKHPRMGQYEHDHTKKWAASVAQADAFAFVMPEYNYFPPSSFINALTYLASEWNHKPVAFVTYAGISGGLRAAQVARSLATTLKMVAIPEGVPVPLFSTLIGEDKVFRGTEPMAQGANLVLDELHKWATALKPMRAG